MDRELTVYLHNTQAGTLSQTDTGAMGFRYAPGYLERMGAHALSVSMPLGAQPYADAVVRPFFSGLLPDEDQRRIIATNLHVSRDNPFSLLAKIGGDCAGALSLQKPEAPPPPQANEVEWVDEEGLAGILRKLPTHPLLAGEEGVRLSLAGAQSKMPIQWVDGKVGIPRGSTPSTHILKPENPRFHHLVDNEFFCMRLAGACGIAVPPVALRRFGGVACYIVERYDRAPAQGGGWARLHQEDFCQALSVVPERKYEAEGGPGYAAILGVLEKHAMTPALARQKFMRQFIFNHLIGNADAHAKNYALLYAQGRPQLAPAYDLVCTEVYPAIKRNAAMRIGAHDLPESIRKADWEALASPGEAGRKLLVKELLTLAERVKAESGKLVATLAGEGIESSLFGKIIETVQARVARLPHRQAGGK